MRVELTGELRLGLTPKDVILGTIGRIGVSGGVGHALEYAGAVVRGLSMEGRMTICNMSIEASARAGMVSPDDTTFAYVEGRPAAPRAPNGSGRSTAGARSRPTKERPSTGSSKSTWASSSRR